MGGCRCLHPSWAGEPPPLPFLKLRQTGFLLPPSWGPVGTQATPHSSPLPLTTVSVSATPILAVRVALWQPGNQGAADSQFRGHACAGFRPRPGATPRRAVSCSGALG